MSRKVIKLGKPMLRALLFGAGIALLGVFALSMFACDIDGGGGGKASEAGKVVYTGTNDDVFYTLTITEKTNGKAAVYTPKTGDSYTLKMGTNLSSGTVLIAESTGNTLKFTLKPSAAAANTFNVTVSSGDKKITSITGTVTLDTGATKSGPGNLSNIDSDTGGSSGSVTRVTLDLTAISLKVDGKTPTLTATVTPNKATNKSVTWTSSNASVASVSNKGMVTGLSAGTAGTAGTAATATANITVTTVDGGKTAVCKVTVYPKDTNVLTGIVTITGYAEVGKTLTANTDYLDGDSYVDYQWKSGTANTGSNYKTYDVDSSDKGKTITVTVTRYGYTGEVTSAPTEAVVDYTLPAIDGTVSITEDTEGKTLTATFTPNGGSGTITYKWYRVKGNTSTTLTGTNKYTLVDADKGCTIVVKVTRAGYSGELSDAIEIPGGPGGTGDTEGTTGGGAGGGGGGGGGGGDSGETTPPTKPNLTGSVTISGDPEVGKTLTANTDILDGTGTFTYQWYRDDEAIQDEENATYELTDEDAGNTIKVTVECSDCTGSVSSNPTEKVTFVHNNEFKYLKNETGVTIVGYKKTNVTNVNIPTTIGELSVTTIGEKAFLNAFASNKTITIVIGANVTLEGGDPGFPKGKNAFKDVYNGAKTYTYNPNSQKWS